MQILAVLLVLTSVNVVLAGDVPVVKTLWVSHFLVALILIFAGALCGIFIYANILRRRNYQTEPIDGQGGNRPEIAHDSTTFVIEFWQKNYLFNFLVKAINNEWVFEHPLSKEEIVIPVESSEDFRQLFVKLIKNDFSDRLNPRVLTSALIKSGSLKLVKIRIIFKGERYDYYPKLRNFEMLSPHINEQGLQVGYTDPDKLENSLRNTLNQRLRIGVDLDIEGLKKPGARTPKGESR